MDQDRSSETPVFLAKLKQEMAKSELLRIDLLLIASALLLVYALVLVSFFERLLAGVLRETAGSSARFALPATIALLVLYSLGVRRFLRRSVAAGRSLPRAYRWGSVTFEALFPTLLILLLSPVTDPVYLLVSPVVLLYGIPIFSAALQMDARTPIYAGAIAVAGYVASYLAIRSSVDAADYSHWLLLPNAYAGRVLLLAMFGLLAAFVAWQTRKRVVGLLEATEEKNAIRRTFGQHVSPQVVDRLLQQRAKPVSEMRHVCVMFLDIRNFTTLSESRSPAEVVAILNELFTFMIDSTNRHDGIVNKFLGDGFLAVFGAPFSGRQDCVNAVATAREILERLQVDNRSNGRSISVGIGLHAGAALTGDVGSAERKEYTVMGDVVNVASRIEQLNKQFDAHVLLSEAVYRELPQEMRNLTDLGPVKVKGRAGEVRIYKMA